MRYNPWFVSGQWVEAPLWPAILSILLVVAAVVAALVAWTPVLRLGWRRGAMPVLGGLLGAAVGAAFGAIPLLFSLGEPIALGELIPSWWAHALPLEISGAVSVVAGASLGVTVAAAAAGKGATRLAALPAFGLALAAALPAVGWSSWLLGQGPIPVISAAGGHAHAGHPVSPTGTMSASAAGAWTLAPSPVVVAGPNKGPVDADLTASNGSVLTGVPCGIEVGDDTEDPRMPLAIGNQWSFGSSLDQRVFMVPMLLGVFDLGTSHVDGVVSLRVTHARDDGPVRLRTVTTESGSLEVYGFNGETFLADGTPVFRDVEGGVQNKLLTGWTCHYGPAEGDGRDLPGPTTCTRAKGGITDVIGSAVVGMATAGLLIPDPSPTGTLVAMTSGNRP